MAGSVGALPLLIPPSPGYPYTSTRLHPLTEYGLAVVHCMIANRSSPCIIERTFEEVVRSHVPDGHVLSGLQRTRKPFWLMN